MVWWTYLAQNVVITKSPHFLKGIPLESGGVAFAVRKPPSAQSFFLRYLHATNNRECQLVSKLTFLRFSGDVHFFRFLTHFGGHLKKLPFPEHFWELSLCSRIKLGIL